MAKVGKEEIQKAVLDRYAAIARRFLASGHGCSCDSGCCGTTPGAPAAAATGAPAKDLPEAE